MIYDSYDYVILLGWLVLVHNVVIVKPYDGVMNPVLYVNNISDE